MIPHRTVARLWFLGAPRTWPSATATGTVIADAEHPHGKWSLTAELWTPPDAQGCTMAWVAMLVDDAPELVEGDVLTLRAGSTEVARVEVMTT